MIRNSAKITFANKSLCFKVLFCRVIIYVICFTICYFLAKATILPIIKSSEVSAVFDTLRIVVDKFFSSNPETVDVVMSTVNVELTNELKAVNDLVLSKIGGIVGSIIGVILMLLVLTFVLGVIDYTVGVLVNDYMSSLKQSNFLNTMFENFANACKYGIYRLVALLLYNVIMYSLVLALSLLLVYLIDFLALPIAVLLFILVNVNRQALAGQTLPNMICGEMATFKAFIQNFKQIDKGALKERFMSYFILGVVMFAVNVISGISTFYVALLLTIPFSAVIYSVIKFVDYYQRNNKKYYVTYDDIVIPKNLRDNDEQLLNKVDLY